VAEIEEVDTEEILAEIMPKIMVKITVRIMVRITIISNHNIPVKETLMEMTIEMVVTIIKIEEKAVEEEVEEEEVAEFRVDGIRVVIILAWIITNVVVIIEVEVEDNTEPIRSTK